MHYPPPLAPGDTIRVVAPSGPFDSELLEAGLARLAPFCIEVPSNLRGRRAGLFAGTDEERGAELQAALDCPNSAGVLIARGGYGLSRIIERLSFSGFDRSPKWVIGFSDATVLHARIFEQGMASLHAPNGTTLARSTPGDVNALLDVISGHPVRTLESLETIRPGETEGRLFGGNLTVLFTEAASGRLKLPRGCVLLLEDVTESSYRIDRMLVALRAGGHFGRVSGIVLGDFTDCSPGKFDVPVQTVLTEHLAELGVPVACGLPVGHGRYNCPLVHGARARLDATRGRLTLSCD